MIVIGFEISEKKEQSAAWRRLFSRIVTNFGGIETPEIYKDENQKPRALGVPFSVSHSADVVMCAAYLPIDDCALPPIAEGTRVCLDRKARFFALPCDFCINIGADLEMISSRRDEERLTAIAERFFTAEESAAVRRDGKNTFYRIWTQKESFLKLNGVGLSRIESANLLSLPEGVHMVSFDVVSGESVYSASVCFDRG